MSAGRKIFIRVSALLFYIVAFFGIQVVLYQYMSTPSPPQSHIFYSEENTPDYFPILLKMTDAAGNDGLIIRSLSMEDYGRAGTKELPDNSAIYKAGGEGMLSSSSLAAYVVEPLPPTRKKVTLSLSEENKRRISIYTYEIENNKIFPREYLLQTYIGDNFSPMPFTVGLMILIVFLSEKFVVKRLKQ